MATHRQKIRAVMKRLAKEGADRVRCGRARYPGDDLCGAERAGARCLREKHHGGDHRGWVGNKRRIWKRERSAT